MKNLEFTHPWKKFFLALTLFALLVALGVVYFKFFSPHIHGKKTPITLAEVIVDNIKQHPKDWSFKEDTISKTALLYDAKIIAVCPSDLMQEKVLINKSCNITLELNHINLNGFSWVRITSPDSLIMVSKESEEIYNAIDECLLKPIRLKENAISDSLNLIEGEKQKIKEQNIINKLCK